MSGSGLVGVILPDTTSSTRYVDFDAPYLKKAFQMAGYSASDFKIDNAQGKEATELALAQADITAGAKVLIFDPLDSTVGAQVQQLAAQAGVALISYDRATFAGTNTYYVSFDNEKVGELIGQGFMDCVSSWNVKNPKVFVLDGGEDTDPNAVSFAKGYNSVIWGQEDAAAQRHDQRQGLHAGPGEDHAGLGQRDRCDDLHAGIHRTPGHQRDGRGQ